MSSPARTRMLWLAVFAAVFAFCLIQLRVTHSVIHFLPSGNQTEAVELVREIIESDLSRSMVLSIGHAAESDRVIEVAAALAASLREHPAVASVRSGVADDQQSVFYDLYFPRRHYFVSDRPESEIPDMLADPALRSRANRLRRELVRPSSGLASRLARSDPLSFFSAIVQRFQGGQLSLELRDGQFVAQDGRYAIVFLETRDSPFVSERQAPLLAAIEANFERVARQHGGGFKLEQSGVNRIAVATELSMRRDLSLISTLTVVGVVGVFVLFFRSLRSPLLVLLPAFGGVVFATAFGILAIHPLHGVTVAFGVSLVGVTVDYSIHLMNHHFLIPGAERVQKTLARLRPSLVLGAVTTMAGFGGLALTDFPGVREMGIFAVVGIGAALCVTLFALPAFLDERREPRPAQIAFAALLGRQVTRLRHNRRLAYAIPVAALMIVALGLPRLEFTDDPNALTMQDPELMAEDARVRGRISDFDSSRLVIATGTEREQALARNDLVWERLQPLLESGELSGVRSLHTLLWSRGLQTRNLAALRAEPALGKRIEAAFVSAGFRPGAVAEFERELNAPLPAPLTFEDLEATPLERLARTSLVRLGEQVAVITYLRGVRSPERIEAALAGLDGVHFFDRRTAISEIYAGYRVTTIRLIALGSLFVFAVLLVRYRSWRPAAAAFLPSILVTTSELGLFGLLGIEINLLGVVSLILVLGMGVDYGIFLVDSADNEVHLGVTMLSLLLSCITTILVFGTLAVSAHPALRAIGLTTGVGILMSFFMAPAALVLLPRDRTHG